MKKILIVGFVTWFTALGAYAEPGDSAERAQERMENARLEAERADAASEKAQKEARNAQPLAQRAANQKALEAVQASEDAWARYHRLKREYKSKVIRERKIEPGVGTDKY